MPISPTYLHKKGLSHIFLEWWDDGVTELPLRGGAGRLGGGEAFGVPQRGTAYQPGVKPRVWRTTGAF